MAPRWGIVCTALAPAAQILAFAAHHLSLGPERIWIHLDDPATPGLEPLAAQPRVTLVRCDRTYWRALRGARPRAHQFRQALNIRRIYAETDLDWLLHIDVDEFLLDDGGLARELARRDRHLVRVEPWEAMWDPEAPPDIFRGRYFRRALHDGEDGTGLAALQGPYAAMLSRGLLGHSAGKCFFRTGIEEFLPAIHSAKFMGRQLHAGRFAEGLALLHFHAEDPERWLARLPYRLEHGAYRSWPELQAFLRSAAPEALADFYRRTHMAMPEAVAALRSMGMLREERLGLAGKVAGLGAATASGPEQGA